GHLRPAPAGARPPRRGPPTGRVLRDHRDGEGPGDHHLLTAGEGPRPALGGGMAPIGVRRGPAREDPRHPGHPRRPLAAGTAPPGPDGNPGGDPAGGLEPPVGGGQPRPPGKSKELPGRGANPHEEEGGRRAISRVKLVTGPFSQRRLKTDRSIIRDLPEKIELSRVVNLTAEQAGLYEAIVDELMVQIDGAEENQRRTLVVTAITRLKQVCNHP